MAVVVERGRQLQNIVQTSSSLHTGEALHTTAPHAWPRGQKCMFRATRWAVGMMAGMAWRAVLPVVGGASASAIAVATRPTPMEVGQRSPFDALPRLR
jgi:hypothetical protein